MDKILEEVDFSRVEACESTVELVDYVLEYFENRIVTPEKYKKVLSVLCLTFKGLHLDEILDIVSYPFLISNIFS